MKKNWLYGGLLALIAAILFFASTADYIYPGIAADLMACWRGLDVSSAPKYPLMAVFARLCGGGNLIAPVCGTLASFVLFLLVASFVAARVRAEGREAEAGRLSHIAASVAVLAFILAPSVRASATHLEPRMFDFLWALLPFALTVPFQRLPAGLSYLYPVLAGILTALGFCDSALALAFAPFTVAAVAKTALVHEKKPYLPLFLFAFFALLATFVALQAFGLDGSVCLRRTADELKAYWSTPGWIFVAIFATLPFLVSLFASKGAFVERPGLVPLVFHGALTFVSILAIATPLSPSSLMEPFGIAPVATSAFAAVVAGYLVAYWWNCRKLVVGLVAGGILALVLAVTLVWNLFTFDGDRGAFADKIARKIMADLGARTWFVSDGTIDNHLRLLAAAEGRDLHVISLNRDLDDDYLARLAEVVKAENVGGSRCGELSLSLSLGVLPFVQDWFATDPSVKDDVAIFGAPDLWFSAGLVPVPEFLFFGADESIVPDWSVWKEFDAILAAPKGWGSYHDRKVTNPLDRLRFSLRRHLGFVANNRGVYLQDKKRDDEAFKMYELVLNEIDRDNICAIFNEVGMVGSKHAAAVAKQRDLERMLKAAVDDSQRRYILWRLGTYYGYIRNPDVFIRLGHAWARSGRPGDALSQIRRAIDFVPTDKRTVLLNMMAALYANENDQQKSRRLYETVLGKNDRDHDALIGLMRLELLDGNSARAIEYLKRAADASGEGNRAKVELAMVALMKNDLAEAKALIKKAIDAEPKELQNWSLLAAVIIQQIDATKDAKAKAALRQELEAEVLPAMEKRSTDQFDYYLQTTKGFVLLQQGADRRREARDAFARAMKARPDINATQDMVLGLDISLDDKVNAAAHAKDVLRRNRNAPLANYVMGSLALGRGEYATAELFLRKAADAAKPVTFALNDLAEVLRRTKKFEEAENYARRAVKAAPGLYVGWETLGSVLMDANVKLDEAESCIRKACELSKAKDGRETDVRMLMSLARVQVRRGDKAHARVTIRKVQQRVGELSDFEKKEFEEIRKGAR